MNAYTTTGQARIQPRDVSALLRANGLAGASLARLEWQRGCPADAEAEWPLKRTRCTPPASGSRASLEVVSRRIWSRRWTRLGWPADQLRARVPCRAMGRGREGQRSQ